MPIFKEIRNRQHSVLIIWRIDEDELFFKKAVPPDIFGLYSGIKSDLVRQQKYAIRLIINQITGLWELSYKVDGSPMIEKNYISISHCKNFACVYYNNEKIGVDIEITDKRILKIADRFLNQQEKYAFGKDNLQTLTLIWAAKEAIFKKYGGETAFFASCITITDIQPGLLKASVKTSDFFAEESLCYEIFDTLVLVYTL